MSTIWIFSGQGTQYYGMGRELYEREPVFRATLDRAEALLQPLIHESLTGLLYRERPDRIAPFDRLLHSHPAIFAFECAMVDLLREKGHAADAVLGYSLGEFAAFYAAGAIEFEAGLNAVLTLAELVEFMVPRGSMLAVLENEAFLKTHSTVFEKCTVVGWNFAGNFVVSGDPAAIGEVRSFLKSADVRFLDLPVRFPFHSSAMDVAQTPCKAVLAKLSVDAPRIPVLEMGTGIPLEKVEAGHLWEVTRNPVNFAGTVAALERSGPHQYIDLGPSGSMATSVKYCLTPETQSRFYSIASPFGQEIRNLERLPGEPRSMNRAAGIV